MSKSSSPLRILLDECIDRRLARSFPQHTLSTVPEMGWSGLQDGPLLAVAETRFDVFLTVDRNLAFQQRLSRFRIAVLVLHARTNRLQDLQALVPAIAQALSVTTPGFATIISAH